MEGPFGDGRFADDVRGNPPSDAFRKAIEDVREIRIARKVVQYKMEFNPALKKMRISALCDDGTFWLSERPGHWEEAPIFNGLPGSIYAPYRDPKQTELKLGPQSTR